MKTFIYNDKTVNASLDKQNNIEGYSLQIKSENKTLNEWLPKNVFEKLFDETEGMTFFSAFNAMRFNNSICTRKAWLDLKQNIQIKCVTDGFEIKNNTVEFRPYKLDWADLTGNDWLVVTTTLKT